MFIAVNLSDEVRENVSGIIRKLKKDAISGNFSFSENLHITLAFIGETNKQDVIKKIMDTVHYEPFEMRTSIIGSFKRPDGDIYWLGIEHSEALSEMQAKLCRSLRHAGFDMEDREFKPHLTIGRRVILPSDFDLKRMNDELKPMEMVVPKISLMKSERYAGKLVYTEVYEKN